MERKTSLVGVKMLSLVLGLIAGVYHLYTFEQHLDLPLKEPVPPPWYKLLAKLSHLEVDFVAPFILVWLMVRITAWVIDRLIADHKQNTLI